MIEIRIYKEGREARSLGEYSPKDAKNILYLLKSFPLEDEDGDILEVQNVHFDVGVFPHIAVFAEISE